MKWSIVGLIALGLLAALCVAVLVASLPGLLGKGTKSAAEDEAKEISIAVATKPLVAPATVLAVSVGLGQLPLSQKLPDHCLSREEVIGKVLLVPMVEGQAFKKSYFATEGSNLHLAATIPEGKRAVAISIHDYSGLKGVLYPGAIVDVVVSLDPRGRSEEAVSITLLEGIPVLAVEDDTVLSSSSPEDKRQKGGSSRLGRKMIVVLQVDSQQAQTLQLAAKHGTVSLALRKPTDVTPAETTPTRLSELLAGPAPVTPQPIPSVAETKPTMAETKPPIAKPTEIITVKPKWEITVIRGSATEKLVFPITGKNPQSL